MENREAIKVVICDDHAIFRMGVKIGLSGKQGVKVTAEASNCNQLLGLLMQNILPDIILLDSQMPNADITNTVIVIKKMNQKIGVIVMLENCDIKNQIITSYMENGASSCITKNCSTDEMYQAINGSYGNEHYFNDLVNNALLSELSNKKNARQELMNPNNVKFTEREEKILRMMCEDKSTKEIASALGLSHRTVASLRDDLKTRTQTNSMASLAVYAVRAGIVKSTF